MSRAQQGHSGLTPIWTRELKMIKMIYRFMIAMCLLVPGYSYGGSDASRDSDIRVFVESTIKKIVSSSLPIPQLVDARLESVVRLSKDDSNGSFLCWLEGQNGRCGYIVIKKEGTSCSVVAFSATCTTGVQSLVGQFLGETHSNDMRRAAITNSMSLTTNVQLVAKSTMRLGIEQVETTDLACSVSSLLRYFQYVKRLPLFGRMDYFINPDNVYFSPAWTDVDGKALDFQKSSTLTNGFKWRPFADELAEAVRRMGILPIAATNSSWERVEAAAKIRPVASSIRRKRLLSPKDHRDRMDMLMAEERDIGNVTSVDISPGMRDAMLLQQDYLSCGITNLDHDVELFLATRGLKGETKLARVVDIGGATEPVILFAESGYAGVLLGFLTLAGVDFLIVYFPSTGTPTRTSMADKMRSIKPKPRNPSNEVSSVTRSNVMARYGKEISNAVARMEALHRETIFVDDVLSGTPVSFERGVHVVKLDSLRGWHTLQVQNIGLAGNWGVVPVVERKDGSHTNQSPQSGP